jgi:hypothetical protein
MATIFTLENIDNFSEKLNIDELYERKRQKSLNQLALFNKILNRIHVRIKTTSRQKIDEQFCWFVVPEIIIGVPKFDQAQCIAYIIDKLQQNGFKVKYIHPNTLFISWQHWVPSYVRNELKKKTGININEFGEKIIENSDDEQEDVNNLEYDPNNLLGISSKQEQSNSKQKKEFTPIQSYKPSGNLVYTQDILNKIETKIS